MEEARTEVEARPAAAVATLVVVALPAAQVAAAAMEGLEAEG